MTAGGALVTDGPLAQILTQNTQFLVVGVIGGDGVGKSRALSLLSEREGQFQFDAGTTTTGIDVLLTPRRLLLLDTQAVLSAAALIDRLENGPQQSNDSGAVMKEIAVKELQRTVLLMAVCHVVIVLTDTAPDLQLLQFVRTADMLCSGLLGGAAHSAITGRRIVWSYNKLDQEQCSVEARTQLLALLNGMMQHSELLGESGQVHRDDLLTAPTELDDTKLRFATHRTGRVASDTQPPLTEQAWLEYVGTVWGLLLRKSSIVSDYCNRLDAWTCR